MLTASAQERDRLLAKATGPDASLTKPFDFSRNCSG
jgi:CheY-like chemotaxis protein